MRLLQRVDADASDEASTVQVTMIRLAGAGSKHLRGFFLSACSRRRRWQAPARSPGSFVTKEYSDADRLHRTRKYGSAHGRQPPEGGPRRGGPRYAAGRRREPPGERRQLG